MSDLFGVAGRRLLGELEIPEPWRSHVDASLVLIDDLEPRIAEIDGAASLGRRSSLHPDPDDRPGVRVDHRVHDRVPRSATSAASPRRSS